jgi:hypothetical protein
MATRTASRIAESREQAGDGFEARLFLAAEKRAMRLPNR